ncbi:MAG: glycosyltransferase family 39 protein [Candidatus Omnitrophica bacterium]|nr:glycosyltransferase family 39 protein [Candidatus Omnitrophota bacterium]
MLNQIPVSLKNTRLWVIVLLLCNLTLSLASLHKKGETGDEKYHLKYGLAYLSGHPERSEYFMDSKMPISALNALPAYLSSRISKETTFNVASGIKQGRYITPLFSLLFCFYIFIWSKKLYGVNGSILSLILAVFAPNMLAHSNLVTTDVFCATAILIASYYFWKFYNQPNKKNAIISVIALATSQLVKYTCIYLFLIFFAIAFIRFLRGCAKQEPEKLGGYVNNSIKPFLLYVLSVFFAFIIIVNIGFQFHKTGTPLKQYTFRSELFKSIQNIPILNSIPMPLPVAYIDGMDWVSFNEKTGVSYSNIYLLGKLKYKTANFTGFKNYYTIAYLYKEPLANIVLFSWAIIFAIINFKKFKFFDNELFLAVPILFFWIYFNYFFNAQIGIRFFIVVLPFIYIFCGCILKTNWKGKIIPATILITWSIISVLSYFPLYISYFNELVGKRMNSYKILADSNLHWGENYGRLDEYRKQHPEVIFEPDSPRPGKIIVEVNWLVGVYQPLKFKWLRDNFKPVDHIAYSFLVYDVTIPQLQKMKWNPKQDLLEAMQELGVVPKNQ